MDDILENDNTHKKHFKDNTDNSAVGKDNSYL